MNKDKLVIESAIAHLNGYALTMKSLTGFNPIAVYKNIKELKKLKRKYDK